MKECLLVGGGTVEYVAGFADASPDKGLILVAISLSPIEGGPLR